MNKKIKNILSVGAITMLTSSRIIPVNALCKNNNTKRLIYRNVYMYINGVKFKLPLTPECPNIECKPQFKPCDTSKPNTNIQINNNIATNNQNTNTNSSNNITTNKPNVNTNSNNNPTINNPNVNTNSNNNITTNKPNTNTNFNNNSTINKPNTNTNSNNNTTNNKSNTNTNSNNNTTTNNKSNINIFNKNNKNNNTIKPEKKPVNSNTDFSSYQQQVLDLVNAERTKRGLSPLTLDSNLSNVATKKAQDMANKNYFDHTSPTYGSPFDMMNRFGISYRTAGENIAKGQKTPQEVMNSWMNSPGHRANILNPDFTKLGVGIAKDSNGTLYWSQMFIG